MLKRNKLGQFIKGHASYWLNKKRSLETNKKISLKLKGRLLSEETKNKMRGRIVWNKGKKGTFKHSLTWRLAQSKRYKGKNHWNWQGGKSNENERIRKSFEYYLWHKACLNRDNYTCQICEQRGGELQVDHIKPFALYPELRLALDNGRTLCVKCHRKTPTWGNKHQVVEEVMPYAQ